MYFHSVKTKRVCYCDNYTRRSQFEKKVLRSLKGHLNAAFRSPWLAEHTDPHPGQGSMEYSYIQLVNILGAPTICQALFQEQGI